MTTAKHNDEIILQLTYGKAAAAIASRLLHTHGFPDNSYIFAEEPAFNKLVEYCRFLPESIDSGTPYKPLQNQSDTIAIIVDFVNADLSSEQLVILAQAVTAIASGDDSPVESLAELLEHIRAGVDNIDDAEDEEERRHLNQRIKTSIESAVVQLQPVTQMLENIKRESARIDSCDDQLLNEYVNQEAQSAILADLEKLAFTLQQADWATAHGFQDPRNAPTV